MTTDTVYLSCADTAKLIRTALRDAFPGVTFSVRSHVYSGGASINVGWTDGPSSSDVDDVVHPFAGGHFDGMIDMRFYVVAVVDSRGRIVGHKSPGSSGSGGTYSPVDDPIPPGGRLVHFGADYVFTNRHLSPAIAAKSDAILAGLGYGPDAADFRDRWAPNHLRAWAVAQALAGRDAKSASLDAIDYGARA